MNWQEKTKTDILKRKKTFQVNAIIQMAIREEKKTNLKNTVCGRQGQKPHLNPSVQSSFTICVPDGYTV